MPMVAWRVMLDSDDMAGMHRGIDLSQWEHILADGDKERQG